MNMKPYAFFIGCNIPARLEQYETSARAVMDLLEVKLVDFRDFNCCGYPLRNFDETSFLLSSAKNLAVAEKANLDILTLCKCCFGSLKTAQHRLNADDALRADINRRLSKHQLEYNGENQVKHFLSVLYHDVGPEILKHRVRQSYKDLKVAVHYGCHALRPSAVTEFDDPVNPSLFDELATLTGAMSVDWANRLDCCGAPLMGSNDELAMDLTRRKLAGAKAGGADYLCSACPWCQIQFDSVQEMMMNDNGREKPLPSILFPQLIGLSMGINKNELGIDLNRLNIAGISKHLDKG
jgi:heterodisulfide reductase subunit B